MTLQVISRFPTSVLRGPLFESAPHHLNCHHLLFIKHHAVGDRVGLFDATENPFFAAGSRGSDIDYPRGNATLM